MAVVNGYCASQDIRDQLGDSGNKLPIALLDRAVNATSRAIDLYCSDGVPFGAGGRRFWRDASVTTRLFRTDDPYRAWVADISGTTGVIVKTDPNADGSFSQPWTTSDYQLEPLGADVVAGGDTVAPYAFWEVAALTPTLWFPVYGQRAGLQITARFGWSAIPDEVNAACILKATSLFQRRDAPWGVAGFGEFGPVRITRADPDVVDLLHSYVKRRSRTLTYYPQVQSLFHRRARNPVWPYR